MLKRESWKCPRCEIGIIARSSKNIRAKNKLAFFTLFNGFVVRTYPLVSL